MNFEALNKQVKQVEALNNLGSYDRAKHLVNEVLVGVSDSIQTLPERDGLACDDFDTFLVGEDWDGGLLRVVVLKLMQRTEAN